MCFDVRPLVLHHLLLFLHIHPLLLHLHPLFFYPYLFFFYCFIFYSFIFILYYLILSPSLFYPHLLFLHSCVRVLTYPVVRVLIVLPARLCSPFPVASGSLPSNSGAGGTGPPGSGDFYKSALIGAPYSAGGRGPPAASVEEKISRRQVSVGTLFDRVLHACG